MSVSNSIHSHPCPDFIILVPRMKYLVLSSLESHILILSRQDWDGQYCAQQQDITVFPQGILLHTPPVFHIQFPSFQCNHMININSNSSETTHRRSLFCVSGFKWIFCLLKSANLVYQKLRSLTRPQRCFSRELFSTRQ